MPPSQLANVAVLPLLVLGACRMSGNERNELGDSRAGESVSLPAFGGAGLRADSAPTSDAPASAGLSRAHWEPTTIIVPIDGVRGRPTYARPLLLADSTARQRGDFPTPTSALELEGDSRTERVAEAALGPFYTLYEGAAMPFRFFYLPPWREVRHVERPNWRAPVQTATHPRHELQRLRDAGADGSPVIPDSADGERLQTDAPATDAADPSGLDRTPERPQ